MNISGNNSVIQNFYHQGDGCHLIIKMLGKPIKDTPYTYENSTVSMRIESTWPVVISITIRKVFMAFIFKVITKRISKLISRFDVPKIPPHMINQLGVEKEATSTN